MGWILIGLGALVGVVWLWLAWRALFADRARQRLRCPKCFYVLREAGSDAPVPDACPECGTGCTNPARLTCTHRHWGRLGWTTLLAVVLGGGLWLGGRGLQHGWGALPDPMTARMVSLDLRALDTHVEQRIRQGYFDKAETRAAVRSALDMVTTGTPKRIEKGLSLLETVYRNAYYLVGDREDAERPKLSELDPARTAEVLIEAYPTLSTIDQARVLKLLSQVRAADQRVQIMLFRESISESAELMDAARFAMEAQWRQADGTRRPPSLQHAVPRSGWPYRTDFPSVHRALTQSLLTTTDGDRFTDRTIEFGLDVLEQGRVAIVEWLPADADDQSRDTITPRLPRGYRDEPEMIARAIGLWLAVMSEGPTDRAFEWIERSAGDEAYEVRAMAIELCLLYEYSDRIESILSSAMQDPRDGYRSTNDASDIASVYGTVASGLQDELLAYAALPERNGWSSAYPEYFISIGGDPEDLFNILKARVQDIISKEESGEIERRLVNMDDHRLSWDFDAIAELGAGQADKAGFLVPIIELHRTELRSAAKAHAAMAGPSELTTNEILRQAPDLSQPLIMGSVQQTLGDMIWNELVITELVVDYALDSNSPDRVDAFVSFFSEFEIYVKDWEPYEPILRAGLESDDPATVDAAQTLIDKHLSEPED